jgi:16S rRNA (adenine1518-N6/adenine1519-N6)-dimethyltransferase
VSRSFPDARKALGQHWLHDRGVCARIVAASGAGPETPVLEIGPGAGALTGPLLETGARVHAVEADLRLAEALEERFEAEVAAGRLSVEHGDARRVDPPGDAEHPWVVVSNLPYNTGCIILGNLLERPGTLSRMVLMFQAEVARRIRAKAPDRDHGILSVLASLEWDVRRAMKVGPGAFVPPPRVQSEVIRLERRAEPCPWPEPRWRFRAFVDAAFKQRRKMLKNALAARGYPDEAVRGALAETGLDQKIRAEGVPAEIFARLYAAIGDDLHAEHLEP